MADYETVNVRRDGAAATIELNRPETLNAWNAQLGHDLLAALARGRRGRRRPRRACSPARARRSRPAPTCATSRAARTRTPEGHPDVQRAADRALPPDHHARPRRCPSRCSRRSTAPRSASGCSLALAADLVIAAESAYFLLAFVNIGLVPDGGSSLFVPSRVGFARAAEMAMLGERIPAPQALDVGPDQPRRARRRLRRPRPTRCSTGSPPARPASYAGRQAPAQPLAVRADGGAARARGRHPAGDGGVAGLRRGRRGVRREAPAGVRRALSRATYGPSSAGP